MALPVVENLYGSPVLFPLAAFGDAIDNGFLQPAKVDRIVYKTPDSTLIFKGEFTVDGMGVVTDGTVTGFVAREGSTKVMTGSGYDLSATELIDAIADWQAFNDQPLRDLFLDIPTKFVGSEMDDFFFVDGIGSNVLGREGNDRLVSFVADVQLKGGKGNDFLLAQLGQCWYTGGQGNDVFAFVDPTMPSKITDFSVEHDLITLDPFTFAGVEFGFLSDDQFKIGKHASTPEQIILFQRGKGNIFFDVDGSESIYAPGKFAKVQKGLDLDAQNFYGEVGGIA